MADEFSKLECISKLGVHPHAHVPVSKNHALHRAEEPEIQAGEPVDGDGKAELHIGEP